jgi:predicted RNA methylase
MTEWLDALERRHMADLTFQEIVRALRALSSCYVERRAKLAGGGALDSRGKRAAFALFYGPLHFILTRNIVRALGDSATRGLSEIADLGCGTGVAGAAWALESGGARVHGSDRNAWAAAEANWTYRALGLNGRAVARDVARTRLPSTPESAILLAYVVNELSDPDRATLTTALNAAQTRGARVLVIEPIARRVAPWWGRWEENFVARGGRADEWRFRADLPLRQRELARAAGLDPRELTARTLFL